MVPPKSLWKRYITVLRYSIPMFSKSAHNPISLAAFLPLPFSFFSSAFSDETHHFASLGRKKQVSRWSAEFQRGESNGTSLVLIATVGDALSGGPVTSLSWSRYRFNVGKHCVEERQISQGIPRSKEVS